VRVDGREAVRLGCTFAGTQIERASWDVPVKLDLAAGRGLRFEVRCDDLAPISHFSLYLRSGKGWYSTTFHPESTGRWETVTIERAGARTEGEPAGWGAIDMLRFSAWRAKDADTSFCIGDVRPDGVPGGDTLVAILRADSVAKTDEGEAKSVAQFTDGMVAAFREAGVGCAILGDLDVTAERLAPFRLVVLPYNPKLPAGAEEDLARFAARGGKLMAFYTVPSKLRALFGIEGGAHVKAARDGQFATIHPVGGALAGAPKTTGQRSWNIHDFKPVPGTSRVVAEWLDDAGKPSGHAAVLGSTNGLVMAHVLLPDDPANKRRLLLAMAGSLAPQVWRQVAEAAIAGVGDELGFDTFGKAVEGIRSFGGADWRGRWTLHTARSEYAAAIRALARGRFADATDLAARADRSIVEAFCAAQPRTPLGFRAFWCHDAYGVAGIPWDEAVRRLKVNGFTAIVPNMLWGGSTFFPSDVLPVAAKVAERGDAVAECLAACRKHGIEMHVWKVNWNLGHTVPKEYVERMRSGGRLQRSSKGVEEPWLCPSHPANRQLEIDSMVEVARKYPVDGIHFDYIRYPGHDHCFCDGCRERFGKVVGAPVANWPADVQRGGVLHAKWLDWRRENISAVVEAVHREARAARPGIRISAAVFREWATDRDGVGQDWKLWCDRGWLDFVCPMDYTPSNRRFEGMVSRQVEWAGKVPCYPGIGVSASSSRFGAPRAIEQIRIAEKYNTGGFIIFNYGVKESSVLLPQLGRGITRPE
jgi:uncharacterized lipoprotein YddW (UPF0748 family)